MYKSLGVNLDTSKRYVTKLIGYSFVMLLHNPQGLKAVDGSIKKESDLPAADPNTPIPLKYEDRSATGACATEKGISLLLERGKNNL